MNFAEIFRDSYQRNVKSRSSLFFSTFYQNFVDSSELVKEAFQNTDMNRQQDMLRDSLRHLIEFSSTKTSNGFLQGLAIVHRKINNIDNNMYDLWLSSILLTIEQIDPDYTEQDGLAWKIMLSPGIEFMKGFSKQEPSHEGKSELEEEII